MALQRRSVESRHGELGLESFLLTDPAAGPRPVVMIFPNFIGLDEVDDENAERIVRMGYSAFGCDLYGKGQRGGTRDDGFARMNPLRENRPLLQDRMLHLLEIVRGLPEVDGGRIAAIGFCFGGLCVLDLARTGADIAGAASFHGIFTPPGNIERSRIRARVAAYHGWADALVPPEDV